MVGGEEATQKAGQKGDDGGSEESQEGRQEVWPGNQPPSSPHMDRAKQNWDIPSTVHILYIALHSIF